MVGKRTAVLQSCAARQFDLSRGCRSRGDGRVADRRRGGGRRRLDGVVRQFADRSADGFNTGFGQSSAYRFKAIRRTENFGHALLERLIERDESGGHPLNMMMLSTSDQGARAITERLVRTKLAAPLAQWFGTSDAEDRAARLLLVTAGLFLYRSVFPLDPLTGELSPGIRGWLESELQAIVAP